MGAERVTKCCATLCTASVWEMGEPGFPVARVCCGWIFLLPFPSPLAPPSYNSLLKETSLGCAELSTAAICKDATRRSSTSQFTGWTCGRKRSFLMLSDCLYTEGIAHWANKGCLTGLSLSICVHAYGGSYLDSHLFEEGIVLCFFMQHLAQCSGCQLLHLLASGLALLLGIWLVRGLFMLVLLSSDSQLWASICIY